MPDGFSMKAPTLDRNMRRLKKIVPEADRQLDVANEKTAKEFVAMASGVAPRDTGDLADSIRAEKVKDADSAGWGVFALWRWIFVEFGTVNQTATPFLFPVYRLLRKRHVGRARRALNKAIKRVLSR